MEDKEKLHSSSLDGVTAFEDAEGNRIQLAHILDMCDSSSKRAIHDVYASVTANIDAIENFIMTIPESFNNMQIISKIRKRYYVETLKIRLDEILKKYVL